MAKTNAFPRSFWDWHEMIEINQKGFFPYTPATNMLQGLKVALDMLEEEGMANVFARHDRAAEATRRAGAALGLRNRVHQAGGLFPRR